MRLPLVLLSLAFVLSLSSPSSADPSLLGDLRPGTESYWASAGIWGAQNRGGILFFAASDPAHGSELWRSDGTPAGTYRVTDICPGPCSSEPGEITVLGGELYFSATDGVSGRELWAASGTPGQARRVRDLCPGPCASRPETLSLLKGRLLFEASVGEDRGLWSTDGSRGGTVLLRNFCKASGDEAFGECIFNGIHPLGTRALFQMNDSRLGVWRTDGTPQGTRALADEVPGGLPFNLATIVPVTESFAALWTEDGLWWTDGTGAGTHRLRTKDELGVPAFYDLPFSVRNLAWKGMLISILPTQVLLRSDGTPEGTVPLGQLPKSGNLIGFAPLADTLLIALQSPDSLWRTEGTPETTRPVMDFPQYLYGIAPVQSHAVLCFEDSNSRATLWVSDGTEAGTQPLEGAPLTLGCSLSPQPVIGGRLLFIAENWEIWGTDGTASGTSLVHAFGEVPASSGPLSQIALNGRLVFSPRTSDLDAPLFVSDGTAAGTRPISQKAGWAQGLARLGGKVYFEAFEHVLQDGYFRYTSLGLWSSTGTEAGTRVVKPDISSYRAATAVGSTLFFSAAREYDYYHTQADLELFRTDGTPQRTGLVKNINNYQTDSGFHHFCYNAASSPGPGVDIGGRLLFAADDGWNGRELWVSDGAALGTRMVRDIDPRRLSYPPEANCDDRLSTGVSSDPGGFVRYGKGALFAATDGSAGRELWWSDGTPAGTRRVRDLRRGLKSSSPHDLVAYQGKIWFIASAQGAEEGLWRTDGTPGGTVLVHPLTVSGTPSWASELTVAGDQLFFRVYNETTGAELWSTHGKAASTKMVVDLRPGPASAVPQSLAAIGHQIVFAADDGEHGLEPWKSDGTAAGTLPLGDINPGPNASGAGPFTPINGGRVLAGADDGEHGRELWVIPVGSQQ
jgi:ELWxxDGT repeat protein